MTIVIVARERSTRFPNKHLYKIMGKSIMTHLVEQWLAHGATKVILATGPPEWNAQIAADARQAGAVAHCDPVVAEWDILGRIRNVVVDYDLEKFILHSGDVLFPHFEQAPIVWDMCRPPETVRVGMEHHHPLTGEFQVVCVAGSLYIDTNEAVPNTDRGRRESTSPIEQGEGGRHRQIPCPWPAAITPVKMSVDYPLEAAVARKIVEHLGRWPENPWDVEKAYQEITEL